MAEQWLSIVEYARSFAVSDMTVRRRIKTGKLKAVLKDGKYYIPTSKAGGVEAPKSSESFSSYTTLPKAKPVMAPRIEMMPMPEPLEPTFKGAMPQTNKQPLAGFGRTFVNSDALLSFCEQALSRFEEQEQLLERQHATAADVLEGKIRWLQAEVSKYKQQVEDLQLLVKMFEQK